jgi:hypothetical protein
MKEIGQELFSAKFFSGNLTDIAFSAALKRAAVCGDHTIKVLEVNSWKVTSFIFDHFNHSEIHFRLLQIRLP